MSRDKPSHLTPANKEGCYSLLTEYTLSSMRLRKIGNRVVYTQEISILADACTKLLKGRSETAKSLVDRMEHIMSDEHKKEIDIIDDEISSLFNKRKCTTVNTPYGEKDSMLLTDQINALEKKKHTCIKEIIESVIYDTFNEVSNKHGWGICNDFILHEYEYREECVSSSEDKSETASMGKN